MANAENVAEAENLVDLLFKRFEAHYKTSGPRLHRIHTYDLEGAVVSFSVQLNWFLGHGLAFPCLKFGNESVLPIDCSYALRALSLLHDSEAGFTHSLNQYLAGSFGRIDGLHSVELVWIPPLHALSQLRHRMVEFAVVRYSAQEPGTIPTAVPFAVHAQHPGQRVHYSPSYFLNPQGAPFGSGSSPAKGLLSPGLYKFGVSEDSPRPVHWDFADWNVPGVEVAHLCV